MLKRWTSILTTVAIALALVMPVSSVSAQEASLSVTKTPDKTSASLGDVITYTFTIKNTGTLTINNLTLSDDKLGNITLDKNTLAPDEVATSTGTYTYTIVYDDFPGPVTNTATATGTDPSAKNITATASASVTLNSPLVVTKSADKTTASPHETVTYTYTITNSSSVAISDITLTDSKLGAITLSATTLAAGANLTATSTYVVTVADLPGPITNTATVQGKDPSGNPVSATSAPVSVSLTINKTLLTKAEVLMLSGVPGKGLATAPGLQKPFNPKSRAAVRAGKKK